MTWTNPNDTYETWIQDIVANSYFSDENIFLLAILILIII